MATNALLDIYTLRARVYPALLALMPLTLTYAASFPAQFTSVSAIGPLAVAGGALYLVSQLVRQAGKTKEAELWRKWGGKPTTAMLRLEGPVPPPSRDLFRSRLARVAPDVTLPTLEEERADGSAADSRYEEAVSVLREATRNQERFPVVFSENVAYGFRRNVWAIKPIGVVASLLSLFGVVGFFVAEAGIQNPATPLPWAALTLDVLFLGFWLFTVTDSWVREAATTYAEALFAASAELAHR